MTQPPDLVMSALGADGGAPCWFGPSLESGIHLRWMFLPALGFPANGFTLFRRSHRPGTLITFDIDPQARGANFPASVRRVEVRFSRPGLTVRPSPRTRLPRIVGRLRGVPVADSEAQFRSGRLAATVESDAIDAVQIDAAQVWRIDRLRYVPVD